jgi:hypothetical protein
MSTVERPQTPTPHDHESLEILPAPLGHHERDLLEDTGRRRLIRHKRQLQMINNPIHDRVLRDESDDLTP